MQLIFQDHALPLGKLKWRGQRVDPNAIRKTMLFTVEGECDDICAVGQTMAAHELCGKLRPYLKRHHMQAGVARGILRKALGKPDLSDPEERHPVERLSTSSMCTTSAKRLLNQHLMLRLNSGRVSEKAARRKNGIKSCPLLTDRCRHAVLGAAASATGGQLKSDYVVH